MSETAEQQQKRKLDNAAVEPSSSSSSSEPSEGSAAKKARTEEVAAEKVDANDKDNDVDMKSESVEGKLASYVDHTNLKQDGTIADIRKLCEDAKRFSFASVCVHPIWVKDCVELLKDSTVDVCTVIGFPLGANVTAVKKFEAEQAAKDGAVELDMVISVSKVKDGDFDYVRKDIEAVREATGKSRKLKVILETCLLTDEEIAKVSKIAADAGADFVKTSTGFSKHGATLEHVRLMRKTVGDSVGVKASGGIRSRQAALDMIDAGATRLGTSSGTKFFDTEGETLKLFTDIGASAPKSGGY